MRHLVLNQGDLLVQIDGTSEVWSALVLKVQRVDAPGKSDLYHLLISSSNAWGKVNTFQVDSMPVNPETLGSFKIYIIRSKENSHV